ncbi:hypothetical protein [Pantoea endophytica]|uniref:hypothetical protein n=1 Tax=Pantoea endophytica TaxID=92488 RepID=UPI0024133247|nr:hypothetical protein [Pantoea endophytica]
MSGYQIFNAAGALVIDSNYKGTYFRDTIGYSNLTDVGYYDIKCQLGNSTDMGFVAARPGNDGSLKWFKPSEGARFFFAGQGDWMTANAGIVARTRSDIPVESGYKDVFNAAGELIWSAVMAAKIPRILGFFDIPANYDLDNAVYSQNIGTNTYILSSALAYGNIFDDGGTNTGYSGVYFRFSGGVLQCQWVSKLQNTWASSFKPYGLRIPYAILPNLT